MTICRNNGVMGVWRGSKVEGGGRELQSVYRLIVYSIQIRYNNS